MDRHLAVFACVLLISSCAVPVKQIALAHPMMEAPADAFILHSETQASIGTGYSRELRAGTHWNRVGVIEQGGVYRSPDQVLTVEGYNVHEAFIVAADHRLVGFYLPVEKTFVRVSKEVALNIENNQEN